MQGNKAMFNIVVGCDFQEPFNRVRVRMRRNMISVTDCDVDVELV